MISAPTLTALATVVIGGFNLIYAARLLWKNRRARRWPTVGGQLLSAELERRKHAAAPARWGLRVLYQYNLGNQSYTGGVISADASPAYFSEELGRLAIAQQWRPGTAVKVHVNPGDPRDAMLAPRVSTATISLLVVGAVLTLAGVWQLLG